MANVASAGTVVAAALETAGYLAQEKILANYQYLFSSIGVLLFVICAIGAFISYAVLGSYNLAKYLVVGPILFYFLVGTTSTYRGVIAKMGGGLPRTEAGSTTSESEALAATRKLAIEREVGVNRADLVLDREIKVAWPFRVYTTLVSKMANALSDLILKNENEADLLFGVKTQAFEALMNQNVENKDLLAMLQGDMLVQCNDMMNASLMLASPQNGVQERADFNLRRASPEYQANRQSFTDSLAKMDADIAKYKLDHATGEAKIFSASKELRSFISQSASTTGSAASAWLASHPDKNPSVAPLTMTCKDGWTVIRDKLMLHAKELGERVQLKFSGPLSAKDKNLLCVTLANKVGYSMKETEVEKCQNAFVEITSIFLLKNAIAKRDQSRVVERVRNDMQVLADIPKGTVIVNGSGGANLELMCGTDVCKEGQQDYDTEVKVSKDQTQSQMYARFRNKYTSEMQWHPVTITDEVGGHMKATFKQHQRYQTRELRQKLFTLVMQLPYYQGLFLFLLAAGYPFFALIVLVPGRATNFYSFALTWLWIKSWDIGFAFVMILDKVLWNLVPTTDFDQTFIGGTKISEQPLPILLSEAMKVDLSFNTHIYYFFLSLAMLSVPVLTAYWTLKLRSNNIRNAIQPLFDGVIAQGENAAQAAGGAYGVSIMNINSANLKELAGTAGTGVGFRGQAYNADFSRVISGGLEGDGRGDVANTFAGISAGGQMVRKLGAGSESFAKMGQEIVAAGAGYRVDYASAYKATLSSEVGHDSARARLNHPILGRAGDASLMNEAGAAALDGEGGFEINDMDDLGRLISAKTNRFLQRYITVVDSAGSFAGGVAGFHAKTQGVGTMVGMTGNMPGVLEAMRWYQSGTTDRNPWEDFYNSRTAGQTDVQFVRQAFAWVEQLMRNKGLSQEEIDELLHRRKMGLGDNPIEIPDLITPPDPDSVLLGKKTIEEFFFINRIVEPGRY
jgi:hypothetical protein